jgi:glucose-1-phosphate adenylyltransferase
MDYSKMLSYHKSKGAVATIAVIPVPWEETHRFGVMKTDDTGRITEFQEKPKVAKSNLASMGVYVFDWQVLRAYLEADEADPDSNNDFGKNIIPNMLAAGEPMYAYAFKEYWKDVGTVDSLWEANMDLLAKDPELKLNEAGWKIFSLNQTLPPQLVGPEADVQGSLLGDGCLVLGKVHRSVIFTGAQIANGAEVTESVIMPGVKIGEGATVHKAIIGENTIVEAGAKIGVPPRPGEKADIVNENGITVIEDNVCVPHSMRIVQGTVLSVAEWPAFPEEWIS